MQPSDSRSDGLSHKTTPAPANFEAASRDGPAAAAAAEIRSGSGSGAAEGRERDGGAGPADNSSSTKEKRGQVQQAASCSFSVSSESFASNESQISSPSCSSSSATATSTSTAGTSTSSAHSTRTCPIWSGSGQGSESGSTNSRRRELAESITPGQVEKQRALIDNKAKVALSGDKRHSKSVRGAEQQPEFGPASRHQPERSSTLPGQRAALSGQGQGQGATGQRPSVALLGTELLQLAQKSSQAAAPSAAILTRSIVGKSSDLLHSLRRHYNSFTGAPASISGSGSGESQTNSRNADDDNSKKNQTRKDVTGFACSAPAPTEPGAAAAIWPRGEEDEPASRRVGAQSERQQYNSISGDSCRVAGASAGRGATASAPSPSGAICAGAADSRKFVTQPTQNNNATRPPIDSDSGQSFRAIQPPVAASRHSDKQSASGKTTQDDCSSVISAGADQEEEEASKTEQNQNQCQEEGAREGEMQESSSSGGGRAQRPPVPPPPAHHVLLSTPSKANRTEENKSLSQQQPQLQQQSRSSGNLTQQAPQENCSPLISSNQSNSIKPAESVFPPPSRSLGATSLSFKSSPVASARRHALLAQSFERDAILSLKVRELKHKRTSSIKSAIRNATHLGPLKLSFDRRANAPTSNSNSNDSSRYSKLATEFEPASTSSSGGKMSSVFGSKKRLESTGPAPSTNSSKQQQKPYELFEPPVTQRSVQRSKRRGAMMSGDSRRQMSADTIGLRQLTDEYLANAGVLAKPISSAGQPLSCGFVALSAGGQAASAAASAASPAGAGSIGFYGTQPQYSLLEAELYQATRSHHHATANHNNQQADQYNQASNGSGNTANIGNKHRAGGSFKTAISMIENSSARTRSNSDESMGVDIGPQQPFSINATRQLTSASTGTSTGSAGSMHHQHQHQHPHHMLHMAHTFDQPDRRADLINWRHQQQQQRDASNNNICVSLAGNLPWQADVSIQCELLPGPPLVEPYETTGDILSTIARPYPAGSSGGGGGGGLQHRSLSRTRLRDGQTESLDTTSGHHSNLSATLRKGLTAISQHHLAPGGLSAQEVASTVVGSLKKSLSNTLDVANRTSHTPSCLYSQDSLPAYSSLHNEPDENESEHSPAKLSRQSSTKLMVNTAVAAVGKKVGLQRALSFDCRGGYSKSRQAGQHQDSADSAGSASSTASNNKHACLSVGGPSHKSQQQQQHHKSSQSITISSGGQQQDNSNNYLPRPYLPQSASQVDFQVPLLPYERMQEALVSSRLLGSAGQSSGGPGGSTASSSLIKAPQMLIHGGELTACSAADHSSQSSSGSSSRSCNYKQHQQQQQQPKPDLDELICVPCPRGAANNAADRPAQREEAPKINQSDQVAAGQSAANSTTRSNAQNSSRPADCPNSQIGALRRQSPPKLVVGSEGRAAQDLNRAGPAQFLSEAELKQNNNQPQSSDAVHSKSGQVDAPFERAEVEKQQQRHQRHQQEVQIQAQAQAQDFEQSAGFNLLAAPGASKIPNSPSFSISADGKTSSLMSSGQLTASEIFSGSNQLIKRPSTFLASDASDAMTQFAQALSSSGSGGGGGGGGALVRSAAAAAAGQGRYRRQAIVPPKLSTDPDDDNEQQQQRDRREREHPVGRLIDIPDVDGNGNNKGNDVNGGDNDIDNNNNNARPAAHNGSHYNNLQRRASADELTFANARRKRSGGDPIGHRDKQQHNGPGEKTAARMSSQHQQSGAVPMILPSFTIDDHDDQLNKAGGDCNGNGNADTNHQNLQHQQQLTQLQNEQPQGENATGRPNSAQGARPPSRPDSQMTNPDSFASSSASSLCKRDLNPSAGLTVAFDTFRDRRRSSIAIIPQMQICPGDLLVYSKQLIERMNQSDEISETPEFLTIEGKKGKNIWSSFKLFDNRSIKARHEYLSNLDEVLNTLQPSTFIDEQLSHYKGMVWNEFLVETESRRFASSEALAAIHLIGDNSHDGDNEFAGNSAKLLDLRLTDDESGGGVARGRGMSTSDAEGDGRTELESSTGKQRQSVAGKESNSRSGSIKMLSGWSIRGNRGSVKGSSSSPNANAENNTDNKSNSNSNSGGNQGALSPLRNTAAAPPAAQQDQASPLKSLGRFKEKPKLKRGQTVDSVFRIPLVPSSPLKHALHHQQTPTAHLENQQHLITTIEDDYESSMNQTNCADKQQQQSSGEKQHADSTTDNDNQANSSSLRRKGAVGHRSSFRSSMQATGGGTLLSNDQFETSFDLDSSETLDLASGRSSSGLQNNVSTGKSISLYMHQQQQQHHRNRQFMRQSSLSTLSSTVTRTEQKRQRALWDLFQSECTFFFDHLMTLKNVYMEPLKKIQVEGFAMQADPDVLFGNLDELCCGVYDFCKEFLQIIIRTLKHQPEELNATDVLIKLYKHNPKIEHLRGIYHRYTLNYINALTYLDSLRRQVEFVEFEKWSSRDARCKKLQLTDLLVAPVQHIMRVPIILKDIESHTEDFGDKKEIRAILSVEEASLRELDDKMRWLKNFERLLEIQKNIIWPSVVDLEPKVFVPDFLRDVLSKQPCEKLIVSPRRQIVHEGTLSNFDSGKACDMHVILFDDMLLFTRRKKGLTKRTSNVCRPNPTNVGPKDDGSFKYIVYKNPLSLDRIYVHDVPPTDSQAMGMKNVILIVVLNRFQQITTLHWFSAPNEDIKQTWQYKMKKTMDRWKKLGNDTDGRRSETMGGHEMTLQEQIQQSMDAEASQVPVELLHNWIDRRNRNSRSATQLGNNSRNAPTKNNQANIDNDHRINQRTQSSWRLSCDSGDRAEGAATATTTLTTLTTKSQSQILPVDSGHDPRSNPSDKYRTIMNTQDENKYLINFRSNPNSPERHQSQEFKCNNNHHQSNSNLTNAGQCIELKITNASVNSEENLNNSTKVETNLDLPNVMEPT